MAKNKGNKGFTLIELLVVITIIMALAGLIVGGAQQARKRALIAKAKAAIASLETALCMYETDYGEYPASGNANMVSALREDLDDDTWRGPYMMFKAEDISNGQFIDPWGNAYNYTNPGTDAHGHENYVDIWSNGPGEGESDDVTNW